MGEVLMIWDNGESYSDHSIEFFRIDPLSIDEAKNLVRLLGNKWDVTVDDESPRIIGFVKTLEWLPKFSNPGKPGGSTWEYNKRQPLKEILTNYRWLEHETLEGIQEEMGVYLTNPLMPTPDHLTELKKLLVKIGVEFPWFKEVPI